VVKKILSFLVISSVTCLNAGVLPADFHFKSADGRRTSFMSQFRDYEEEKVLNDATFKPELYIKSKSIEDLEQPLQVDSNNEKINQFIERIKLIIAQIYKSLSMKRS